MRTHRVKPEGWPAESPVAGQSETRGAKQRSSSEGGVFRLIDRIVVPVEGTDREYLAQQWAAELAASTGAPLRAVHVSLIDAEANPDTFSYIRRECAKWGVDLKTAVLTGTDVAEDLVGDLGPRDLVVIGTRRLSKHFHVGSVAQRLVELAPCPVQIVRLE